MPAAAQGRGFGAEGLTSFLLPPPADCGPLTRVTDGWSCLPTSFYSLPSCLFLLTKGTLICSGHLASWNVTSKPIKKACHCSLISSGPGKPTGAGRGDWGRVYKAPWGPVKEGHSTDSTSFP